MPSYGGNAFIKFRWVNTYIIAFIFHAETAEIAESMRTQNKYGWNYAERTHFVCACHPDGYIRAKQSMSLRNPPLKKIFFPA